MQETPDLSKEFHPVPKPAKKEKKTPQPINPIGKKGKEDIIARSENKRAMEEMGITTCEIRFEGCWHNNALSFAHPDKRRNLTREDLRVAIVACVPCHQIIEAWPHQKMKKFVLDIIKKRHESY